MDVASALKGGKLSMANPDSVPAGRYGKEALEKLGAWAAVEPSVVRAENVRSALRFVEAGEAAAGIVYATDAKAAGAAVTVVGTFPADSHTPITYPGAIMVGRSEGAARDFLAFLGSEASLRRPSKMPGSGCSSACGNRSVPPAKVKIFLSLGDRRRRAPVAANGN